MCYQNVLYNRETSLLIYKFSYESLLKVFFNEKDYFSIELFDSALYLNYTYDVNLGNTLLEN